MNKLTTGSAVLMAALAAGHAEPVSAKGLTRQQVQNLIRQEISKIPRVRGPGSVGPAGPAGTAGPAGPAGMDGFPFLFAHINAIQGTVDGSRSLGITQENLVVEKRLLEGAESPDPEGNPVVVKTFCFTGLPPIMGGQATMDGSGGYAAVVSPKLELDTPDGCPVRVSIHGSEQFPDDHREPPIAEPFYILLY
jgi:hypothetical protein